MYENHGWPNIVEISDNDRIGREPGLICKECKYKAEDIYDYDGHVWSEICTDPTVQKEQECNDSLSCEFGEDKFARLRELMQHKKKPHAEFPLTPMGVLAHRLRTLDRSLVPPSA